MGIATINKTLELALKVFDKKKPTIPTISTFRGKPVCPSSFAGDTSLPRCTPEEENIPSEHIISFLKELKKDPTLDMHDIIIMRHGKVIAECTFGVQTFKVWKYTFSACKSVTSLAIGMLADDGKLKLTDKVCKIFEDKLSPISSVALKNLTIKDLLTMRSSVVFNEAACMTEEDWTRSFLSSLTKGEIGKTFNYNSLNTYMLSAIVKRISGKGLYDFLKERLFTPLGIKDVYWEKSPEGIEKGGWGLFIRPEDLGKIGQLVMQKGKWEDKVIVSEKWIDEATAAQAKAPEEYGDFDYGYQIWTGRHTDSFLFNGMLGQNVLGYKNSGIIVVSNAGNGELFQQSNYFKIVNKYFAKNFNPPLEADPEANAKLNNYIKSLSLYFQSNKKSRRSFKDLFGNEQKQIRPEQCDIITGRTWKITENETAVGIFPVILQAVNNNYSHGLRSISFDERNGKFCLIFKESDETNIVPIGFTIPERTTLRSNGEPYDVASIGSFAYDEDENLVLKLHIGFIETPCSRDIKIYFKKDGIVYKSTESPGADFLIETIEEFKTTAESEKAIGGIIKRFDIDYIAYKISSLMEPVIKLK